ncbi:MAG: hypothetical protein R2785_01315 [Flavobacteriaceae bacterium]
MKNTFRFLCSLILVASFTSCAEEEGTIYEVLQYETGAVLRTINVNSQLYNSSIPTTEFSVTVEEQDEQDGALLESVDIYVTLRDLSPGNGTAVADDKLVKSYPASAFTAGPVGLPRATLSATYAETFAATGLSASDIEPGDLFLMELRLNLTDGRTFGKASAAGIITGGFFFSPFVYNALIVCSPQPGDYTVDMHDSYGDGWQTNDGNGGDGIHVDIDGTIVVVGMCSPYGSTNIGTEMDASQGYCVVGDYYDATDIVTIPNGTESATWNFPGDNYGEISFEVYGPGGEELYIGAQGETGPGLLPITLCAM